MFTNLPNFFFENPLIEQQVTALIRAYLNQQMTIDELKKAVEILEDIEDTIKQKVIEQIEEMAEDGTLQTMVAKVITDMPTKAPIDFSRLGRKLFRAVESNTSGSSSATADSEFYSYTQGGTFFTHNGEKYWCICNVCSNYSHFVNNNVVDVRIYTENGTYFKNRSFTLGHANDVCYADGYLYFVWNKTKTEDGTDMPSRNISRIRFENFDSGSLETKTPPTPTDVGLTGIAFNNGELFISDGHNDIYKYIWSTNTIAKYIDAPSWFDSIDVVQNISVNRDYVFWLGYRPNCIIRCNRNTKIIDYMYQFDDIANRGMYKLGEPQAMTIDDDGVCHLVTSMHLWKKAYNQFDINQFWVQNLYKNNIPASNIPKYDYKNLSITVDGRPDVDQKFNPDGSDGNEFTNLPESILFACTQRIYDKINIECLYTYGGHYSYIATNKTINIIGKYSGGTTILGGIQIDGGIVTIQDCNIWNSLANDTPTKKSGSSHYNANGIDADSETYEIYARDCVLNMSGCQFVSGKPIGIYCRRGFINNDGTANLTTDLNTCIYNKSGTITGY